MSLAASTTNCYSCFDFFLMMVRKPGPQHNVKKQDLPSFYVVTRAEEVSPGGAKRLFLGS